MADPEPIDYLTAAIAYYYYGRPKEFKYPADSDEISKQFTEQYGLQVGDRYIREALKELSRLNLLDYDEDQYAGTTVQLSKDSLDSRYRSLVAQGYKLYKKGPTKKYDWFKKVFANPDFLNDLVERSSGSDALENESQEVPASDRIVTILHNSEEGKILSDGIRQIVDDLDTNNEVASEAGEDRERLLAEGRASSELLAGERVRASSLRSVIWNFLEEIAQKFKEKAANWGVEKMIALMDKILGLFS